MASSQEESGKRPGQMREEERRKSYIGNGRRVPSTSRRNLCLKAKAFTKALENTFRRGLRAN